MESGREVMRRRLLQERKEDLEKNLKKDKNYIVVYSGKFVGVFSHFEEENGEPVAVFTQDGRTDRGSVPKRKIKVRNLHSAELLKQ